MRMLLFIKNRNLIPIIFQVNLSLFRLSLSPAEIIAVLKLTVRAECTLIRNIKNGSCYIEKTLHTPCGQGVPVSVGIGIPIYPVPFGKRRLMDSCSMRLILLLRTGQFHTRDRGHRSLMPGTMGFPGP